MEYFDYCTGLRMTNDRFDALFGGPSRRREAVLQRRHMDLAASVQTVVEDVVVNLVRGARKEVGSANLCLAGGVALNCVANGKVLRDRQFDNVWIQPAAGDAGGAVGTALIAYHLHGGQPRTVDGQSDKMQGTYLGPSYDPDEIEARLVAAGARFERLSDVDLVSRTVDALARDMAVGWFQGRMEFGPRALGNRSIVADPRSLSMQKTLNQRIKYRESFRPFAPSVLEEDSGAWFDIDTASPYMLLVAEVLDDRREPLTQAQECLTGFDRLGMERSQIPAVTHVDYSARLHTVSATTNPRFHSLLSAFKERTGCPILVNTSFNVRGEPIVCTPEDAFRCFMGTAMERLVIGNCFLVKDDQDQMLKNDCRGNFELD
jgi:carbamoyltransferase